MYLHCLKLYTRTFMKSSHFRCVIFYKALHISVNRSFMLILFLDDGTMYEGHLKSLWTHLITPSQNFVTVQWWSLFQNTSLGKQCTS